MVSAHFIAKLDENRRTIDNAKNLHASGVWDISQEDAARLVGGRLYLHKTKSKPAFHGGTVVAFRVVQTTPTSNTNCGRRTQSLAIGGQASSTKSRSSAQGRRLP